MTRGSPKGGMIMFGAVPEWFFLIAIIFAVVFIIIAEWNSRR
jgi:hypothetical protein